MNMHLAGALRIAAAMTVAEILLVAVYTLRMGPAEASLLAGVLWALAKTAPLFLVLPGLLRGSGKASAWLCYLLCGYFIGAVLTASLPPPASYIGFVEVLVVSTGFVAGLLATRWSRQPSANSGPAGSG